MNEQSDTQTDARAGRGRRHQCRDAFVLRQRGVKPKLYLHVFSQTMEPFEALRFHNGRRTRPEEETKVEKGCVK